MARFYIKIASTIMLLLSSSAFADAKIVTMKMVFEIDTYTGVIDSIGNKIVNALMIKGVDTSQNDQTLYLAYKPGTSSAEDLEGIRLCEKMTLIAKLTGGQILYQFQGVSSSGTGNYIANYVTPPLASDFHLRCSLQFKDPSK